MWRTQNEFLHLTVFPLDAARLHDLCYVAFSNALTREVKQTVQIDTVANHLV
jgi:hypothetical protein